MSAIKNFILADAPLKVATVSLVNQSASIPSTALYTTPADGLFRLMGYAQITTAGPITGKLTVNQIWTDLIGATSFKILEQPGTVPARFALPDWFGELVSAGSDVFPTFFAAAGTDISYSVIYDGGAGGAMRYAIHLVLERLS